MLCFWYEIILIFRFLRQNCKIQNFKFLYPYGFVISVYWCSFFPVWPCHSININVFIVYGISILICVLITKKKFFKSKTNESMVVLVSEFGAVNFWTLWHFTNKCTRGDVDSWWNLTSSKFQRTENATSRGQIFTETSMSNVILPNEVAQPCKTPCHCWQFWLLLDSITMSLSDYDVIFFLHNPPAV